MSAVPAYRHSIFADRHRLVSRVLKVTVVALLMFVWPNWMAGAHELAFVGGGLVAALLSMLWFLRLGVPVASMEILLMICALVLFTSLLLFPSIEGTGLYWVSAFPFVAYFIRPVRDAIYWVAAYSLVVVIAASFDAAGWIGTPYSSVQIFCLLAVVLFFWFFAHIYQSQLEYRQELLESSNRELDEQKGRMQTVLDHAPLSIWMQDASRRIQFVNKATLQWAGVSEDGEADLLHYSDYLPVELRQHSKMTDRVCLEGESGVVYDRESVHAFNGGDRVIDVIKVRRTAADGRILGLVGFGIDVTEKVKADEAQKQLERQMEHAQRLESLGVMAGGIAHDFNNLLTAVQGNVELAMMEKRLTKTMQECLAGISSASRTAADLCRQMLAYSGKGILRPEVFSLRDLTEDMRPLLEASAGKSVKLEFDLSVASLIHGDRGQVRQVLLNMVMNASEAMVPERDGTILVSLHETKLEKVERNPLTGVGMPPGCYVELMVVDNGSGMDVEVKERMFEPFFTTKFTGRGLGLSAILGILRAHDAGLEVESVEGVGTTMRVLFPCVQTGMAVKLEAESPHVDSLSGQVLVVDDETQVLKTVGRMLERMGFEAVLSTSGEEAVRIFSEAPDRFGWVLLDVTMPGMNGRECLRSLRQLRPDIRVVMSSGYSVDVTESAGEDQPDEFLGKPYTFKSLQAVAAKMLENESNG